MANVKITWDNSNMDGATDVQEVKIYRKSGDSTSSFTDQDGSSTGSIEITASDATTFVSGAQVLTSFSWPGSGNITDLASEYIDGAASDSTTYTYGIFSSNANGANIGPGAIRAITT